jgi:hypothetical protein
MNWQRHGNPEQRSSQKKQAMKEFIACFFAQPGQ